MPTEQEYKLAIQACDHNSLLTLWNDIKNQNTPNWDAGKAFEYMILRAFEIEGAEVDYPYPVKMQNQIVEQIDGFVHTNNLSVIIECKDYKDRKINVEPFAKLRNQLLRRPSPTIGAIFATTDFSEPAMTLASFMFPQTILLWEKAEIEYSLNTQTFCSNLITKYKYCSKTGLPNYNIIAQTI